MIGIYRITNTVNNKIYIGQSTNIKRRWRSHKCNAKNEKYYNNVYSRNTLYYEMHYYGLEKFKFEVLEECSVNDLNDREAFYIKLCNAIKIGYNVVPDSYHSVPIKLDDIKVFEIKELLRNSSMNQVEIAELFGVNADIIRGINHGRYWVETGEVYPISGGRKLLRRYVRSSSVQKNKKSKTNSGTKKLAQKIVDRIDLDMFKELYPIKSNRELAGIFNISKTAVRVTGIKLGLSKQKKKPLLPKPTKIKRVVLQYDLNGNLINSFASAHEAARALGDERNNTHINEVIRGKRHTALGFVWKIKI